MKYLIGILGLLVVFGLAYLASNNRKEIKYRPIIIMVVIQVLLSALLLNTKIWLDYYQCDCQRFWKAAFIRKPRSRVRIWRHCEQRINAVFLKRPASNRFYLCLDWDFTAL